MWELVKPIRALQTFIVAASSDKIASQTASQAVVTTMLFGIIIGNMQLGTILSVIGMLPSIIFAFIGAKYAGKHGNKEAMVTWTYVCITVAAVLVVLFIFIDPTLIATTLPMMIVYVLLTLVLNGAKMCVTMSSNAMMADIIDYELDRSGKFIPAAVTGTYSFIDQVSILVFCSDCNRSGGIDRLQAHDATADRPVYTGNLLDDDQHVFRTPADRLGMYALRNAQDAALQREDGGSTEEYSGKKTGRSGKSD